MLASVGLALLVGMLAEVALWDMHWELRWQMRAKCTLRFGGIVGSGGTCTAR